MSALPEDLVEEILSRVPARSLFRLRSTCKKWNALLHDRRFTKKHFDKAEKKYSDMFLTDVRVCWMSDNLHGLDDTIDPSIKLNGELNLKGLLCHSDEVGIDFEVFHCNGLLLITNTSTTVVWNPCTGQTKCIQTRSANTIHHKYALGYENTKSYHDYKIMRSLDYETFELEIYDFNSYSWRVVDSFGPDFKLHLVGSGLYVKGDTYWIASDSVNVDEELINCFLISFDFTTERFGPHVCLPFEGYRDDCDVMLLWPVREERLLLCFLGEDAIAMDMWMTNDITETNVISWSKILSIDINTRAHGFNNGISKAMSIRITFFIDEENKATVLSENVPDANDHSIVDLEDADDDDDSIVDLEDGPVVWPHMYFCYAPSLVRI